VAVIVHIVATDDGTADSALVVDVETLHDANDHVALVSGPRIVTACQHLQQISVEFHH
jgi:hypothetical protein